MTDTPDTSREAVERLAAILDNPQAQPDYYGTAATLRALLDERERMQQALEQIMEKARYAHPMSYVADYFRIALIALKGCGDE